MRPRKKNLAPEEGEKPERRLPVHGASSRPREKGPEARSGREAAKCIELLRTAPLQLVEERETQKKKSFRERKKTLQKPSRLLEEESPSIALPHCGEGWPAAKGEGRKGIHDPARKIKGLWERASESKS